MILNLFKVVACKKVNILSDFYLHRFWRVRSAILFDIVATFKIKIYYFLRIKVELLSRSRWLFDFFKFFYPSPRAHFSFDHNQAYFLTFSIRHFQQDQTHDNLSLSIKINLKLTIKKNQRLPPPLHSNSIIISLTKPL